MFVRVGLQYEFFRKTKMKSLFKTRVIISAIIISILSLGIGAGIASGATGGPTTYGDSLSAEELSQIKMMVADSPPTPPEGVERLTVDTMSASAVILTVPTSTWTYGCTATSAGMIFGYYDRNGYPNMYTGTTNGGVCPLTDLGQGISTPISGSCSIIATQNGFDGRTIKGHVDDYWTGYEDEGPDPFEGSWTEHTWGDCTADYMGTNQWKWDYDYDGTRETNTDGSTIFFYYSNGSKLYDYVPPADYGLPQTEACHGMRLFAESRGYTVEENYTQLIDAMISGGFSLANYRTEINNGYPVMIHVNGHTMVGVGYESSTSQIIYVHDTWDNSVHSMTWGSTYSGLQHIAVTVIHLSALSPQLPGQATDPDPANGAREIDYSADLSWTADPNALSHDVYFGTASPGTFQGNQTGTTFEPGTLANGTTYYWRIDEKNDAGTTTGAVWSFTTIVKRSLTTSATVGGTVITPGMGTYWYVEDSNAKIAALADSNYYFFVNWTGSAVTAGKVEDPCSPETTVLMDNNYTVRANFDTNYRILTTSATGGGTVTTPGIGKYFYDKNTYADIAAQADSDDNFFVNWTGSAVAAGNVEDPNSSATTVLMAEDYTVQANFGFAISPLDMSWLQRYNGSLNSDDYAIDIAADSSGNVYVTGYAKISGTNYDFTTIKYSPDGNRLWTKTYNRYSSADEYAQAMAIDAGSNVIVAGYGYTSIAGYDCEIVKYDTNGNKLWAKAYNSANKNVDKFYDVAVDANGNIYAVGVANNDYLIIKYASDGTQEWVKTYNGSANEYDGLYQVVVDNNGVYACGEITQSGTELDCVTVKYSPDGTMLWMQTYDNGLNLWDGLEAITLDAEGNVYVCGSAEDYVGSDYITMKYSASGEELWSSLSFYSGVADGGWDEAMAITVCSDGDIAVTGYSPDSTTTGADSATVKYDSETGEQIWVKRYSGSGAATDYTDSIGADSFGNIYVHGRTYDVNSASTNYLTICYNSEGVMQWRMSYNGLSGLMDAGTAMVIVNGDDEISSNVYVTGCSQISKYNYDYVTIKYSAEYPDTCPEPPVGDLNGDCYVNLLDLAVLAGGYMNSDEDWATLGDMADTWLECGFTDPNDCWQ